MIKYKRIVLAAPCARLVCPTPKVRTRYWRDTIYTNIGAIVLALNPYNYSLPLYTDDNMPKYIAERADALNGAGSMWH